MNGNYVQRQIEREKERERKRKREIERERDRLAGRVVNLLEQGR